MSAAVTLETDQEFSGAFIKLSGCLLRGATIQKRIYTMRAFFPSIFSFYELQMVLMLTQSMKNGTIDWFSPEKGYGFIMPDDGGKAVFVHISALEQAGLQKLSKGQRVSFEISTVKGKASASTLNLQTATLREAKSIDLNRTKYAYVFTETTALLVRNRIAHILMLCILSAAYTYFRGIHLMIIILWCGIAAGLMLDLWLIRLRYVNNTYGQSALELAEIGRYLEQKAHIDKDDIGGGQRIEFIIEDEKEWDAIPQGAVQTA